MAKPKLDDLIKQVEGETAPKKEKKPRQRQRVLVDHALDVELIRLWIPHLIATDFDQARAIELAFTTKKWSRNSAYAFAKRLIGHPMFTELMATHIDQLDDRMAHSERYVLDKLYRQAEANIVDYFQEDEFGRQTPIAFNNLPKWKQQNIKKLKVHNRIVEFKGDKKIIEQTIDMEIVDSFRAIALLGKNMGMFVERVEIEFGKQTADRLEAALERAKKRKLIGSGPKRLADKPGASGPVH